MEDSEAQKVVFQNLLEGVNRDLTLISCKPCSFPGYAPVSPVRGGVEKQQTWPLSDLIATPFLWKRRRRKGRQTLAYSTELGFNF